MVRIGYKMVLLKILVSELYWRHVLMFFKNLTKLDVSVYNSISAI